MTHAHTLFRIERTNLVLAVAAIVGAGLVWRTEGMIAAAIGAALGCGNFYLVHRLGARAVRRMLAGASGGQAGRLVAALMAKMLLLFALVGGAVAVLRVSLAPFALGLSVFVISILMSAVSVALHRAEEVT